MQAVALEIVVQTQSMQVHQPGQPQQQGCLLMARLSSLDLHCQTCPGISNSWMLVIAVYHRIRSIHATAQHEPQQQ